MNDFWVGALLGFVVGWIGATLFISYQLNQDKLKLTFTDSDEE